MFIWLQIWLATVGDKTKDTADTVQPLLLRFVLSTSGPVVGMNAGLNGHIGVTIPHNEQGALRLICAII